MYKERKYTLKTNLARGICAILNSEGMPEDVKDNIREMRNKSTAIKNYKRIYTYIRCEIRIPDYIKATAEYIEKLDRATMNNARLIYSLNIRNDTEFRTHYYVAEYTSNDLNEINPAVLKTVSAKGTRDWQPVLYDNHKLYALVGNRKIEVVNPTREIEFLVRDVEIEFINTK